MDNKKKELITTFCLSNDLSTYDPYDIWKTKIGLEIKQLYYKNKYLGIFPAGILTIYDLYINNKVRIGYKKQEYPIVRAQAALSLINLYTKEGNKQYLDYAGKHIYWLLNNYSKNYSGYCWGLNFNWVYSAQHIYNKNIPFSTHTPYPLEALVKYYRITNDEKLLEPIKSVFLFLEYDLKVMEETDDILIMSYGVEKDRIVTNSNSYIMFMYALLIDFFPEKEGYIKLKIKKIYSFLKLIQKKDGSWLYSPYDTNSFIDCFHSAFVLKNIYKTSRIVDLNLSNQVIEDGYKYIKNNFFDTKNNLFKRFSLSNKLSLTKYDLYDNAEMLNLAVMLNDKVLIKKLCFSIELCFVKGNEIASLIDITNSKKNYNYLRWAIFPYLLALSNLKPTK